MTAITAFVKDGVGIAITDTCVTVGADSEKIEGMKKIIHSNNLLIGLAGVVPSVFIDHLTKNIKVLSNLNIPSSNIIEEIKKSYTDQNPKRANDLSNISLIVMKDCEIAYTPFALSGQVVPNISSCNIGNGGSELQAAVETIINHNDVNLSLLSLEELKKMGNSALQSVSNRKNGISSDCYVYKQVSSKTPFTETVQTQTYELMGAPKKQIKAIVATNRKCSDNWVISDENLQDIANQINTHTVPMVLLDDDTGHIQGKVVNPIGNWIEASLAKVSGIDVMFLQATGETLNHDIGYGFATSITLNVLEKVQLDNKNITKKVAVQDIAITKKPADESCLIIQAMDNNEYINLSNGDITIHDLTNDSNMNETQLATNTDIPVSAAIKADNVVITVPSADVVNADKVETVKLQEQTQPIVESTQTITDDVVPETSPQVINPLEEEVKNLKLENEKLKIIMQKSSEFITNIIATNQGLNNQNTAYKKILKNT